MYLSVYYIFFGDTKVLKNYGVTIYQTIEQQKKKNFFLSTREKTQTHF